MYHNIILIYELLRLKEEVTKESATSLDCLENAFIELQLIINEEYDLKEKRSFAEALEEVIDIYGFLFDIEEDIIAFNDEYQYEEIEDAILEILDNEVTRIDDSVADLKHNIMVYQALELDIPVFGMVKNDKHQTRALINEQRQEFEISENLMNLITKFQDEVHDTAISYHRKLRDESITKSELDDIKGIGETKKKALLKYFGSVEKIRNSSIDELLKVNGINEELAKNILQQLN